MDATEAKAQIRCSRCQGTGTEPGSLWTLTLARQDSKGYNEYRLRKEYGDEAVSSGRVMGMCPGVVSPLHFNDNGTDKCSLCYGTGESREFREFENGKKRAAEAEAKQKASDEYLKEFTYLKRMGGKESHWALGAKNIKTELARAFPGIAFSVKSEAYSGGNSINVSWENGPTTEQVKAYTDKYQEGNFDGMIDLYEYGDDPFPDLFGGAKYVFENRHYSEETLQLIVKGLCTLNGVEYKEPYYNMQVPGIDRYAAQFAGALLGKVDFPANAKITGIERTDCTCGRAEDFYRVNFK